MTNRVARETATVAYRRDSAFSYECHACNRCCHDKVIRVNPYEVGRLARSRGITSGEFLSRYTENNGSTLRRVERGACVFLTDRGCAVHADRPLVCRLYPLGRRVTATGDESFRELAPHPQTEGEYSTNGTVAEFLVRQGALPYIDVVDRYLALIARMLAALRQRTGADGEIAADVRDTLQKSPGGGAAPAPDWLDMDLAVARHCEQVGLSEPIDVEERTRLHLEAIEVWLDGLRVRQGDEDG